jgi:putative ABC transport system substrate-binding protein
MMRTVALLILAIFLTGIPCISSAGRLVAAILSSDLPRYRDAHRAMMKSLAQRGFQQPAVEFISQTPNADPISWANSIRKAEVLGADVVVTYGASVSLVALQEGIKTPIVFADVYGPVEVGLSKSMTTMESRVCGVSSKVPLLTLMKSASTIKSFKTLAVIYSSREAGSLVQLKELKRIAASLGFAINEYNVSTAPQLDHLLNGELQEAEALFVSECSVGSRSFDRIAELCQDRKIPLLSTMPDAAEKGALLALEIDPTEQGQLAAEYVARLLSGKRVLAQTIATPKHIELIVNLKVARQLSLTVPFQVLSAATRAIK